MQKCYNACSIRTLLASWSSSKTGLSLSSRPALLLANHTFRFQSTQRVAPSWTYVHLQLCLPRCRRNSSIWSLIRPPRIIKDIGSLACTALRQGRCRQLSRSSSPQRNVSSNGYRIMPYSPLLDTSTLQTADIMYLCHPTPCLSHEKADTYSDREAQGAKQKQSTCFQTEKRKSESLSFLASATPPPPIAYLY